MKNAVLSIKEANFSCSLEHDKIHEAESINQSIDAGSFVDPDKIDEAMEQAIKQEAGGVIGYIFRQVKMMIDTLTLKIEGLDLQIILPTSLTLGNESEHGGSGSNTILLCADELKLLSFGRTDKDGNELTLESDESKSIVKQKLSMQSFLISILQIGDDENSTTEHPLIEPFSYSANVTKAGYRFGSMMQGLEVTGCVEMTTSSRRLNLEQSTDSLVFHVSDVQINTLTQLSVMVLSPPSDTKAAKETDHSNGNTTSLTGNSLSSSSSSTRKSFTSSPSYFHFPLASASVILFDNSHAVHVAGVDVAYKADGTICKVETLKIEYESAQGGKVVCTDMLLTARPIRRIKFGSIKTLHIPGKLKLTNPIAPKISFQGNVMIMRVEETVDVVLFGTSSSSSSSETVMPLAPCAVDAFFRDINVKRDADGSSLKAKLLEIYASPANDCTQLAVKCSEFKTHLALVSKIEMSCSVPAKVGNTVNAFNLSVEKAEVKGGQTSEEWSEGFRPRPKGDKVKSEDHSQSAAMNLPRANIATLKVTTFIPYPTAQISLAHDCLHQQMLVVTFSSCL